ncbi:putative ubiquitin carboxyl-terminal hydrolase 12 [Cercophora samala]|uniref:ubiquitinyl hydrolase 1 n=1 Tax=Cercophora samala TaxID=330535 RepID=A0AA39ZNS8_9PEZI|nr:putative ubiquitin carboxyl-terminal hydrolase 12 [Cercophora samala]
MEIISGTDHPKHWLEVNPDDLVLPSTEEIDPTFSFTEAADIPTLDTPTYLRHGDSLPPSGVPPRLQTQCSSVADSPSAASSPCASADLSVDFDRGAEFADPASSLRPTDWAFPGSQSASFHNTVHRALMGGAADLPQRSSSPLKRPASSMEPETDNTNAKEDVVMETENNSAAQAQDQASVQQEGKDEVMDAAPSNLKQSTPESNGLPLRNDIPPLDQQIKTIETLVKAFAETPIKDGDEAYLVSRKWLQRAQAFGLDSKHVSKEVPEGALGPVDNSDIIQAKFTDSNGVECVKLKPGLGTESFELFPKDAWDLLLSWYGLANGQAPIIRLAHNTAPDTVSDPVIQFEFHPPVFTIHRLWSATSPIPIEQEIKLKKPGPPIVVQSTSFSYHKFLKQVKSLASVAPDRKVRVWRVLQTIPATEVPASDPSETSGMMKTPPDSPVREDGVADGLPIVPGAWPEMLVDVATFLPLEKDVHRALVEAQDTSVHAKYNGNKSLSLVGLNVDQTLVLDEEVERNTFVSTFSGSNDKNLTTRNSSTAIVQARANVSGRSSPALSAPLTRGRAQQKSGRTNGCVGLQNLGNTCYMNSALQCLRAVEELTKYFLTHEAKKEINTDNPLAHNGDVAAAYGRLLEDIYKDPTPNSVAPRQFKSIIGRYAPTFSGYGQQDSQEFLGWLLDGLQEDLNRILKKPYIEKPDSTDEMINNPAAIREMALQVWDITKKRDDSVISDLFTGLYKSTLVCPECNKISITFDPFTNLTLPLPMANSWSRDVKFYPLNEPPVNIVVDIDRNSTIKALKQFISQRVGVPVDRLMASEEFSAKFFKHYDDATTVSEEISSNDVPVIHELEAPPSNLALTKEPKKQRIRSLLAENDDQDLDDPMIQSMVVPVLHMSSQGKFKRKNTKNGLMPPHFIVLNPEEACSEDIIRRKVLEKVATFTTHPDLAAVEETDAGDNVDPEMANMASDADSSGDSKIVAKSVEGEEDIVDVTMADAGDVPKPVASSGAQQSPQVLKVFKRQRPKWIDPDEFLAPQFQNLFDLCFFSDASTLSIPTGWQSVTDGNAYPRLSTRQPKPTVSDVEMQSPGAWPNSDASGSDEANEVTRMADESSEDDSDFHQVKDIQPRVVEPPVHQANVRGGKKKLKARQQQMYGKKGKKRFDKQQKGRLRKQPADTGPVEGPLVRLGEGIIVDWNEEAWEVLFEGQPGDSMRGCKTWENPDTLVDPVLEAKKKQKELRAKHGISLEDCLDEFEKEEILSEQDTWYCPRCKEHRRASKKFDLWKTPDILVVHLKRFSSSAYRREKLDILVDFPVEGLDLTTRVIDKEDGKQEIYDLIAVDDHWGGLGGGHYTAYAKSFNDGAWYEYNDTSVTKCSDPKKVVSSAAYLLFYRRRSETPLGGPKFQEIFDKYERQVASADQDMSDSGEGQRLGQGSSLRGSPSASTGAGLTLPRGKRGLVSDDSDRAGQALVLADPDLPSYQASIGNGDEDTEMGAALWDQSTLQNSIEGDEDEGIGLPDYDNGGMAGMTSVIGSGWTFQNIKPGSVASDGDIASDIAQNDNSSNGDAFAAGDGMDEVFMSAPPVNFVEPEQTFPDEEIPAPPAEAQNLFDQIAEEKWAQQQIHTVPADIANDQASDKVAEIRVGDGGEDQQAQVQKPSA